MTVALGFFIERAAYKPLRSAPRMSVMISAIGVSYLLQNAALYFGEMAEIAYKNGGRPSFTLTLEDIVPNGARARNFMDTGGLFADSNTAYNNTLPDFLKAGLPEAQFSSVVETEIS